MASHAISVHHFSHLYLTLTIYFRQLAALGDVVVHAPGKHPDSPHPDSPHPGVGLEKKKKKSVEHTYATLGIESDRVLSNANTSQDELPSLDHTE